ncbi:MAG: flagellar basal body rod protein FlgC [Porticoccaceae bacterium]|nr:flagellar basal body rod protein FlgC [Porticoccaceae bacterium]|tara:strand:+ start:554 stop:979 length:426 start_codon:yes stop_codon:yes gene_type:complete
MSINNIFGIAGSALNAQMVRMNTSASNMANAGSTASSEADAYKAKRPVFEALLSEQQANVNQNRVGGVKVVSITDDMTAHGQIHDPGNPNADENGIVYLSNVNEVGEMVEMMAAARSYQNNVEVINTARQLMMRTLDLTKA